MVGIPFVRLHSSHSYFRSSSLVINVVSHLLSFHLFPPLSAIFIWRSTPRWRQDGTMLAWVNTHTDKKRVYEKHARNHSVSVSAAAAS